MVVETRTDKAPTPVAQFKNKRNPPEETLLHSKRLVFYGICDCICYKVVRKFFIDVFLAVWSSKKGYIT